MSNLDETRRIIEQMRARRAAMGDNTDTSKRVHYKRMTRPLAADGALFLYTFTAGMLFGAVMQGSIIALLCFLCIVITMLYTYLRE